MSTDAPYVDFRQLGNCAGTEPDRMFPDTKDFTARRAAKQTCLGCPVAAECLSFALRNDERYGVWGGLTEHERAALKRGPRRTLTPA